MKYNKFKNKWTRCLQCHNHQSKKEAEYCNILEIKKKNGEIRDYIIQKSYDLVVLDVKVGTHKVDFLVENNDCSFEVHEVKMNNYEKNNLYKNTPAFKLWILKKRIFEINYPDIKYIVI